MNSSLQHSEQQLKKGAEQSRAEEGEETSQPGSHGNGRQLRVLLGDAAVPGVRGAQVRAAAPAIVRHCYWNLDLAAAAAGSLI